MDEKRFGLGTVLYVFNQDLSRILLLKLNKHKRVKFGADWEMLEEKLISERHLWRIA